MFKKIAALAVTFACVFSFMASATFLDDNPRFVQVGHDDTTESYIDMNTIQSVRYDPPYYIIRATVVTYDYANNTVQGYDNNFFYNFKAQTVKTQTLGDVGYDLQGNVVSTLSLPNPEVKTTGPPVCQRQCGQPRFPGLLRHEFLPRIRRKNY